MKDGAAGEEMRRSNKGGKQQELQKERDRARVWKNKSMAV